MMTADPIDSIQWLDVRDLRANSYNPNVVLTAELRRLEANILQVGWIQPVLVTRDRLIIDGFHRWSLARDSPALRERYGGKVPCAVLDLDEPAAMMLTVAINRAKGSHVACRMSELVRSLVHDHGVPPAAVAAGIGAHVSEVDLLVQEGVFIQKDCANIAYSQSWVPGEGFSPAPRSIRTGVERPTVPRSSWVTRMTVGDLVVCQVDWPDLAGCRKAGGAHSNLRDSLKTIWYGARTASGEVIAGASLVRKSQTKALLGHCWVNPEHRRKGLSVALTQARLGRAIAEGYTVVEICPVYPETYEAFGFKRVGTREQHELLRLDL